MRPFLILLATAALSLPAHAGTPPERQSRDAFHWRGAAPGVFLRNLNGPVTVEAAQGNEIEIVGTVSWVRGDPSSVKVELRPGARGVTACVVHVSEEARCGEHGDYRAGKRSDRDGDVSVALRVKLPAGATVDASSVNGGVTVTADPSRVVASTVNGSIRVASVRAPLRLSTVNGRIEAELSAPPAGELELTTVNGDVRVAAPHKLDLDIDASTVRGAVSIDGQSMGRAVRATLGRGGPKLTARTTNGQIRIE
jgi:hypothetical protein